MRPEVALALSAAVPVLGWKHGWPHRRQAHPRHPAVQRRDGLARPWARTETVDIHVVPLGNSLFAVSWQEKGGATVTTVQDHDRGLAHSPRPVIR